MITHLKLLQSGHDHRHVLQQQWVLLLLYLIPIIISDEPALHVMLLCHTTKCHVHHIL